MGRLRNYEPIDKAAVEEEDRELYSSDGSQRAKILEGRNVFRFLPRKRGMKSHIKTVHRHFVENVPGRDGVLAFNCPRKMMKPPKPCPECEHWAELMRSGNPVDQDQAREHLPRSTSVANVIDRSREADGPLLLHFGKVISEALKEILDDEGDYTNPEDDGFDIVIIRKGSGRKTKYTVKPDRESRPLSDDEAEAEEWIENQWSLEEQATCLGASAIREALAGGDVRRSERQLPRGRSRGEEEDEPRGGYRRRRDPDEEEEAPRKRHRSRAEDDEPRIPPARGRRARRRNVQEDVEGDAGNDDY